MSDWWSQAGNKAKAIASMLAIVAALGGWFWSVFVVADEAGDAKELAIKNDERVDEVEDDIIKIQNDVESIDSRLEEVESDVDQIKSSQIRTESDVKYNRNQLDRLNRNLEKILEKGA